MDGFEFIVPIIFGALSVYAVIAMCIVVYRRKQVRREFKELLVQDEQLIVGEDKAYDKLAEEGKLGIQNGAYTMHLILLICGIISIVGITTGLAILYGFALFILTPVTLIVDMFWIYSNKVNDAEQAAFVLRRNTTKLKAQIIIAWIVWISYTLLALVVTISSIYSTLSQQYNLNQVGL